MKQNVELKSYSKNISYAFVLGILLLLGTFARSNGTRGADERQKIVLDDAEGFVNN